MVGKLCFGFLVVLIQKLVLAFSLLQVTLPHLFLVCFLTPVILKLGLQFAVISLQSLYAG
jgi:hypothetical protein